MRVQAETYEGQTEVYMDINTKIRMFDLEAVFGFKVKKLPLRDRKETTGLDSYQAIVRCDTGKVLGVTSTKYKPIQNEWVLGLLEPAIEGSSKTRFNLIGEGKTCAISVEKNIGSAVKAGDDFSAGLRIIWGHGGGKSVGFYPFIKRLVCLNGMITPRLVAGRFSFTHFGLTETIKKKKAEFQKIISERLKKVGLGFLKEKEALEKWARTSVQEAQVQAAFQIVNPAKAEDFEKAHYEKAKEVFMGIWHGTPGRLYDLYNTMTNYITHENSKKEAVRDKRLMLSHLDNPLIKAWNFCQAKEKEVAYATTQ